MNCVEDLEHFMYTVCPKYTVKRNELKCPIEQLMNIYYDMNLDIMFILIIR